MRLGEEQLSARASLDALQERISIGGGGVGSTSGVASDVERPCSWTRSTTVFQ